MTTDEAIAIAAQAKPIRRQPLDKLGGTNANAAAAAAHIETLKKRFDVMGGTVAEMQKQLDRAKAGVALFMDVMKIKPANLETLQ
jgi:hypothetical protein